MEKDIETEKVSDKEIGVIETVPEKVLPKIVYSLASLKDRRQQIKSQKDSDNALRDTELADVDFLISDCERLGITE